MDRSISSFLAHTGKLLLGSTLVGILTPYLTRHWMKTGLAGVDYYAEAHMTRWNSYMHTIGMPFTIYGMVLWIPGLLRLDPTNATRLMTVLYGLYGGHYFAIDTKIAILYYLVYGVSLVNGLLTYYQYYNNSKKTITNSNNNTTNIKSIATPSTFSTQKAFRVGLLTSIGALLFQEYIGHWLGGDIPSRWEAIPNAILYAKFFSLSHMF